MSLMDALTKMAADAVRDGVGPDVLNNVTSSLGGADGLQGVLNQLKDGGLGDLRFNPGSARVTTCPSTQIS